MSRLTSQVSRPHPSDNPVLFLFLVGGVTPSELRLIKEIVTTHKPGTQVSWQESDACVSYFGTLLFFSVMFSSVLVFIGMFSHTSNINK